MRITLNPKKTYLGFPSIQLLGQMVSSLGTSASLDKVEASLKPKFTQTLAHLNTYIGLFNRFADNTPLSVYRKIYFYGLGMALLEVLVTPVMVAWSDSSKCSALAAVRCAFLPLEVDGVYAQ
ncbi:hypothetical protein BJX66DRAFT_332545 [Aspergillus keveii]|uniref:Uncharacterized protein n=1 Tax=Aspergillus keveii TaxID=714993 RepID=A0ABR4GN43_9EURO